MAAQRIRNDEDEAATEALTEAAAALSRAEVGRHSLTPGSYQLYPGMGRFGLST